MGPEKDLQGWRELGPSLGRSTENNKCVSVQSGGPCADVSWLTVVQLQKNCAHTLGEEGREWREAEGKETELMEC